MLRVKKEFRQGPLAGSFVQGAYTASRLINYVDDAFAQLGEPRDFHRGFIPNEKGWGPFDRTHRLTFNAYFRLPWGFTLATINEFMVGRPITLTQNLVDIDGDKGTDPVTGSVDRVPGTRRGAGNRQFGSISELNSFLDRAGLSQLKIQNPRARLNDGFVNTDIRISKIIRVPRISESFEIEPAVSIFNLFNVLNEIGAGFAGLFNGFLPSTKGLTVEQALEAQRGTLVGTNTAGGVFGSGGPRAFQLELRINF